MSKRCRLHKMLKARGVDYWCAQQTTFFNGANGSECIAYEYGVDAKLAFKVVNAQPEQAIAATLGRGTCKNDGNYVDGTRFKCSRCGWNGWVRHASDGRDHLPKHCPECGAEVVSE